MRIVRALTRIFKSHWWLLAAFGLLIVAPDALRAQRQPLPIPPWRFVVYGDTRTHDDIHQQIVNGVLKYHPALVLQTGDLVDDGSDATLWQRFDKITAPLRRMAAYYPAHGNHDDDGRRGYAQEVREPFRAGGNKFYYAFDKGRIRFIALDTEQSLKPNSPQYQWLVREIDNARAAHRFIIPFFHVALFSIGAHGSDHALQKILHPLFVGKGIKLVFQGHDHLYYHTVRDGITYIVTGGGGAPLYDFSHLAQKNPRGGDKYEKVYHFCVCDVSRNKVQISVRRKSLTEIEHFSIAMP